MPGETVEQIFERLRQRLEPALNELPDVIGEAGVNYALEAFEKQGLEGVPWQARRDKKNTKSLLVKTGYGRRSIRVIRTGDNTVTWGTDVGYMRVQNDGAVINRPARSETFVRPRYERGKKGDMFGGLGAFRKITAKDGAAAPAQGQSYKAYNITIPARPFLKNTPPLRAHLKQVAKEYLQNRLKQL